ncbi:hypothetical protein BXT86_02525 [candidate division WOR-3 bacterium 4484_100]|uniref:Uncharacterized protein n=1 Tax=candidate division WOR-3 bacterium 4484_100 TaxID=1936077 RepID=A0A1V4QHG9_UNCW3|nr:MAG: hypothetical protein BXT86_02525 [candidate division WOR-3 bacterium 4484_100]
MVNRYTAWSVMQESMNNSEFLMLNKNDIADFEFRLSDLKKDVPLNLFQGLNFFNQKNQRNQKNEKNQNTISDFGLRTTLPYNEQPFVSLPYNVQPSAVVSLISGLCRTSIPYTVQPSVVVSLISCLYRTTLPYNAQPSVVVSLISCLYRTTLPYNVQPSSTDV